jgi:NitT/TauT family transport system permease protein
VMSHPLARIGLPVLAMVVVIGYWEWAVHAFDVKSFVLPAPSLIWQTFVDNSGSLLGSAWITLRTTAIAFFLALFGGVTLAILFSQSQVIERALYPYAVILQVTPVVAIAPLINIWVGLDRADLAVLILALIVAFFPILSNTTTGLKSVDLNLKALFQLYGATRWQTLIKLQLPSALPFLLAGMKISGGLALIGTVVAEFAAGSGTSQGLAWRIIEAGNRLQVAKSFAALGLLSGLGIIIFFGLTAIERLVLKRWHESQSEAH